MLLFSRRSGVPKHTVTQRIYLKRLCRFFRQSHSKKRRQMPPLFAVCNEKKERRFIPTPAQRQTEFLVCRFGTASPAGSGPV